MSRVQPRAGCHELTFRAGLPLDDPAEVALEDYARALAVSGFASLSQRSAVPSI